MASGNPDSAGVAIPRFRQSSRRARAVARSCHG